MQALDIQTHLINSDLLPASHQELIPVIGLDNTLKLARRYPSVPLYIPTTARADHDIARLIGSDAFKELVGVYGGDTITLAKMDAAERQIKHHLHKQLKQQGASNREVALELNYSQRHVERLNTAVKDDHPDLFED